MSGVLGLPRTSESVVIHTCSTPQSEERIAIQEGTTAEKVFALAPLLQNQQIHVDMQNSNPVQRDGKCLSSREVRQISKEVCTALAAATIASGGLTLLAYLLNKYGT